MEEEKAAAYYEELTRKGEGAARFKQGLGFSSNSSEATNPTRGSALPSSSSFLSSFVKASSPGKASEFEKQAQLENIQNKLKKKQSSDKDSRSRVSDRERSSRSNERDRFSRRTRSRSRDDYNLRRRRSLSREVDRRRDSGRSERRIRSRSRSYSDEDQRRDRDRGRSERSRRSRSRSYSDEDRRSDRDRGRSERSRRSRSRSYSNEERRRRRRSRERHGKRRRSRSSSPQDKRLEKSGSGRDTDRSDARDHKDRNSGVDYSSMIKGYADMTPAERVKAKMKLQLSQTADKDTLKGMGAGWERFEFNKDAPLDDEEIEVAEDDALVVKSVGQSFRFSAVEAKREEQIRAIHDEAMFGAPAGQVSILIDREPPSLEDNKKHDNDKEEDNENGISKNLISDKVLAKQQGSWRDRARKLQNGSKG